MIIKKVFLRVKNTDLQGSYKKNPVEFSINCNQIIHIFPKNQIIFFKKRFFYSAFEKIRR